MVKIFTEFMGRFILSNFTKSMLVILSNALLLIIDLIFISSFYMLSHLNYSLMFLIFVGTYLSLNILQHICNEKMRINLKNTILHSLWKNIHENESDNWILGYSKYFRFSFVNQIFSITEIYEMIIKYIIPSFLSLIVVSIFGIFFQYYQNITFTILVAIFSYFIEIENHNIEFTQSSQLISHEIKNITSSRFWNQTNNSPVYTFKHFISVTKYMPFAIIFSGFSLYSILSDQSFACMMNLVINLKLSIVVIHNILKVKYIFQSLNDMTKYLITFVNEKKAYSLTFLNKGGLISIEHLTYFNSKYCALNDVSINISTGDRVVLVGKYGKTIFLNIIAGLLWNYKGSVFINNVNISYVAPYAISNNVAYVMQIDRLFLGMSIKDNILLGSSTLSMSLEEILDFVELNHLSIMFENGIETIVSLSTYIPIEIINKISIARALVRIKTAGIILIDNPYLINRDICKKLLENVKLTTGKTIIISDKGSEFMNFSDKFLFIDNSGNAYYGSKDVMPTEYYELINSSLYT